MVVDKDHCQLSEAKKFLRKSDKTMAALIREVGPTAVRSEAHMSIFQSLVRAIAYQMISTKAASAIHGRLEAACQSDVRPDKIIKLGDERLRDLGFSRAKVASLIDLSDKFGSGEIPDDETLETLTDKELVRILTTVRGIGAWSVEMLMIFNLGRTDVFPASDLGVRKGYMFAYNLDEMPEVKEFLALSLAWQPYRTVAAWYLWRATDSVDWEQVRASTRKLK